MSLPEITPDDPLGGDEAYGGGSGTMATKFQIFTRDTLWGLQAYFGSNNQNPDPIRIALYNDNGNIPGDTITTTTTCTAGLWDAFSTYLFGKAPIILNPGTYWVGVSQMSVNGYELGGNASRSSVDWIDMTLR